MIVADTGAVVALIDAGDRHHAALKRLYLDDPDAWVLPWAILPEVDYLTATHLGARAQDAWLADLAGGHFVVEWGCDADLERARALHVQYRDLSLGLVDAVVLAVAERLKAAAIATLDLRHFGAVALRTRPRLVPRDDLKTGRQR
jgi:predicted nucleic acid-binding protein